MQFLMTDYKSRIVEAYPNAFAKVRTSKLGKDGRLLKITNVGITDSSSDNLVDMMSAELEEGETSDIDYNDGEGSGTNVSPMEGVQNLKESRSRFAFELDERRHDFLFNAFKSELCVVEIVADFSAELLHCIVILDVFARDERSTELQKRRDAFRSRCLVSRVERLGGDIEAKRSIRLH